VSRLRFATAQALFEHFPSARDRIRATPTQASPQDFLRSLISESEIEDAVSFCCYLLARREAVWWGCRSVQAFLGDPPASKDAALLAAEAWAQAPDDNRRKAAYEVANRSDRNSATTWLALAAAWSGGPVLRSGLKPVPAAPQLAGQATRTAILLAARSVKPSERAERLKACVEHAIRIAENGL
jgi:hypothetical protein